MVKPLLETALALGFNLGPYSQLGSRQLVLSRASYCGIYTGAITDWSDPQITADNGGVAVVSQATTIDAVYRSDGSGTTFMFTDHLNDVCAAAGKPYSQGVGEMFNLPNPQPPGSSFIGANGGSGMVTDILTPANPLHGAIGYLTPSFVKPLNANGPPAALAINARGFAVFPNAQSAFYAARFGPFAKPPPGYPQTMPHTYLTDPLDYRAYPITGMVMMYFYRCYPNSDADVPAMQAFFNTALAPDYRGTETPYDVLANQNGLGQLPGNLKQNDLRSINAIRVIPPSTRCS